MKHLNLNLQKKKLIHKVQNEEFDHEFSKVPSALEICIGKICLSVHRRVIMTSLLNQSIMRPRVKLEVQFLYS